MKNTLKDIVSSTIVAGILASPIACSKQEKDYVEVGKRVVIDGQKTRIMLDIMAQDEDGVKSVYITDKEGKIIYEHKGVYWRMGIGRFLDELKFKQNEKYFLNVEDTKGNKTTIDLDKVEIEKKIKTFF